MSRPAGEARRATGVERVCESQRLARQRWPGRPANGRPRAGAQGQVRAFDQQGFYRSGYLVVDQAVVVE